MGLSDYVVLAILGLVLGLAIAKVLRDRRRGKTCSGCSGDCGTCAGKCSH